MGAGDDTEQRRAMLHRRALALRAMARAARVMAGTLAERDLEHVRAEIEETIAAIAEPAAPAQAIVDRLAGIAQRLGHVLYMGGINPPDGPSVSELQKSLADWIDAASDV